MLKYIDVHSHIAGKEFDADRDEVYKRLEELGGGTITIGVDLESSRQAIVCAEKYEHVWATVGLHPLDNKTEVFDRDAYADLVKHPKVVGVGECGLDYYRGGEDKEDQKRRFGAQVEFALEHEKPLMIHGRPSKGTMDAYEDILEILSKSQASNHKLKGNVHFFVGDTEIAKHFFDIGFTVSFSGVITFAREYEEVVREAPLTMMHAETDSPYAAPVPHRGSRNEPAFVTATIEKIAAIKGEDVEVVRRAFLKNAVQTFGIAV